jgi:hypothetical protein
MLAGVPLGVDVPTNAAETHMLLTPPTPDLQGTPNESTSPIDGLTIFSEFPEPRPVTIKIAFSGLIPPPRRPASPSGTQKQFVFELPKLGSTFPNSEPPSQTWNDLPKLGTTFPNSEPPSQTRNHLPKLGTTFPNSEPPSNAANAPRRPPPAARDS